MKERGKMSLQQKLIQLPLVGMILLCLLALVYLLAWKRFSKRDPSATIIKHSVDTSPDDASSIGQRTKCAMPNPPNCRMSRLSSERNSARNARQTRLIHTILDERERQDATT